MKTALNLLPPIHRRKRLVRRRAVQWSIVLLVVLSAMFAARSYKLRQYDALRQQLEAVSREGRPAQAMLSEITKMRQRIQRLQRQETIAGELEEQRQVLALLGAISQAARRTDGRLHVGDCRVVDLQSAEVRESGRRDTSPAGTVTLTGVALDSSAVAEFHEGLLQSGLFVDVELKTSKRDQVGAALSDFEVRCEL